MGIYDREYFQEKAKKPSWGGSILGNIKITPVIKALLTINIAVYLLNYAAVHIFKINFFMPDYMRSASGQIIVSSSEFVKSFGLYTPYLFNKGCVWQLFTYQFMHVDFSHILFNMFSLFMIGRHVEHQIGSKSFLRLYLAGGVFAGLINILFSICGTAYPTIGASGSICAVIAAFGLMNPNTRLMMLIVFFPVVLKAKTLVIFYAAITVFMSLSSNDNVAHFAHLGGLVFGWMYVYNILNTQRYINVTGQHNPRPEKLGLGNFWKKFMNSFHAKPKIYKGQSYDDAEVSNRKNTGWNPRLDKILDKMSKEGIQSLSSEEWELLDKYRKGTKT